MRNAVKRLRNLVSNKDIVPLLMHFIYCDGWLYASNGNLTGSARCDDLQDPPTGRFAALASEFQAFIDKTDADIRIDISSNGSLSIKSGKLKASFPGFGHETGFDIAPDESGEVVEFPDSFISRLEAVRPFVSDNATKPFATCILMRDDDLYATSNVAIAHAKSGVRVERDFLIPYRVADYLIKNSDGLSRVVIHDNRSAHFFWTDGSWLAANGLDTPYPKIGPTIAAITDPTWDVPAEWKKSIREIAKLGDQQVDIFSDRIISQTSKNSIYEVECDSPFPEGLSIAQVDPKYLQPVFDAATKIEFIVKSPKVHINFTSDILRGVGLARKL